MTVPSSAPFNKETLRHGNLARPSGGDDENGRSDADLSKQPLRVAREHPHAPVRARVADRGSVRRAVDPDTGRRKAHPARPERVSGPGRYRIQTMRPASFRRIPPRPE